MLSRCWPRWQQVTGHTSQRWHLSQCGRGGCPAGEVPLGAMWFDEWWCTAWALGAGHSRSGQATGEVPSGEISRARSSPAAVGRVPQDGPSSAATATPALQPLAAAPRIVLPLTFPEPSVLKRSGCALEAPRRLSEHPLDRPARFIAVSQIVIQRGVTMGLAGSLHLG